MNTILVTGGAGFIGSNFILRMTSNSDIRIINLDKLSYAGSLKNLESICNELTYSFVHGDIRNRNLVQQILNVHMPIAVINFAAETHVDRSILNPDPFIENNILGTYYLLEEVRKYWNCLSDYKKQSFRFLHISTDEVYGSLTVDDPPFTEFSQYSPNSPYSASKASSDHIVRSYFHTFGLPTLITNCSNNYGPFQYPDKLIPLTITNAINGRSIPVYGDGSNIRDWLYVDDHCRAIELVLSEGSPGENYNIGGNSECSNIWIVERICTILADMLPHSSHFPFSNLIAFVVDRPGHDQRYAVDYSKIREQLGWNPSHDIERGLFQTIQWYINNQDWYVDVRSF